MQEMTMDEVEQVNGGVVFIFLGLYGKYLWDNRGGEPSGTDAMGNVW